MRNASVAVCVAVALLLALPGFASAQAPAEDSVVGAGSVDTTSALSFDVRSGPLGENPVGEVSVSLEPGGAVITSSSVDCLLVSGSSAAFAGTLLPNSYGLTHYGITVEDAGPTASTPDLLGFVITTNAPPGCSGPTGVNLPLITGDIAVVDARSLPSFKYQCKNGGWRKFPSVKNQGACVSFVAKAGKHKP